MYVYYKLQDNKKQILTCENEHYMSAAAGSQEAGSGVYYHNQSDHNSKVVGREADQRAAVRSKAVRGQRFGGSGSA